MPVKIVVAVTDPSWFGHLKTLHNKDPLAEINFWKPPPVRGPIMAFKSLKREGQFFLFKLKGGPQKVAGGGIFCSYIELTCYMAWDWFGQSNGAPNLGSMITLIAKRANRNVDLQSGAVKIGCRVLTQPFFFEESEQFDIPSWSRGIQTHKRYSTDTPDGRLLWERLQNALRVPELQPRTGKPQIIQPRLGQGAFRTRILQEYNEKCAVTKERTLPVLEAAHIRPYSQNGSHEISNGLLLRRDIHRLFDQGYVTVRKNPESAVFDVSDRIKEEFGNGREYYELKGRELLLPSDPDFHPSGEKLEWHNDEIFLG